MPKEFEVFNQRTLTGNKTIIREKQTGGDDGCLFLWIPILIFWGFAIPYKLIDIQYEIINFSWFHDTQIWIFCIPFWFTFLLLYSIIKSLISQNKFYVFRSFKIEVKFFALPLIPSISLLLLTFTKVYSSDKLNVIYFIFSFISLLITYYLFNKFTVGKKVLILSVMLVLLTVCYFFSNSYYSIVKQSEIKIVENYHVAILNGANLRSGPGRKYPVINSVPYKYQIEEIIDSVISDNSVWFKINYDYQPGWLNKSVLSK